MRSPSVAPADGAVKAKQPRARKPKTSEPKKETRGQRAIRFIETFCHIPEGSKVGEPFILDEFERDFILAVFDNPRAITSMAILSIARKNGKTAFIAALVLVFIVGPEAKRNAQIVSGAMSLDQAALVYNMAWKIVMLSPRLRPLVRPQATKKRLVGLPMNTEYVALAAEGKTAHGKSPILAILDEVGQIRGPTDPFVEAITTSQGAHEAPLLIAISTQAPSDADMLSLWIDDAVRSDDPHIVCRVYAAPEGCELMDEAAWDAANPARFRQRQDLRRQAEKAVRIPANEASFRNLCLNQRVAQERLAFAPAAWRSGAGAVDLEIFRDGRPVHLGLDLSMRTDLTAAVAAAEDDDGNVHLLPFCYTPLSGLEERARRDRAPYDVWVKQGKLRAVPGSTIDYDWMCTDLVVATLGMNIASVQYDRWRMDVLKAAAARTGFDRVVGAWQEVGQGFRDISPRLEAFEAALLGGRLRHGGHPLLTMAAANAIAVADPAGARKLDKSKSTQRIDPMVASIMAAFPTLPEGRLKQEVDVLAMVG
jgi:phage terminase large subunit-like protein